MLRFLWPLAGFILLSAFLAVGLFLDPGEVPSPLIGKPAPDFKLARLPRDADMDAPDFSPRQMLGKVWMFNVWASWCVSCRAEHPLLVELAKSGRLPIVGLNYKEVRGDGSIEVPETLSAETGEAVRRAKAWLNQHGDPYTLTVMDIDGRVGINYGVYGVPESYLIDKSGVIRYKQIGPLDAGKLREQLLPLVAKLEQE